MRRGERKEGGEGKKKAGGKRGRNQAPRACNDASHCIVDFIYFILFLYLITCVIPSIYRRGGNKSEEGLKSIATSLQPTWLT